MTIPTCLRCGAEFGAWDAPNWIKAGGPDGPEFCSYNCAVLWLEEDVVGFHEADRAFLDAARTHGWYAFVYAPDKRHGWHRCIANRERRGPDDETVHLTTQADGTITAEHFEDGRHRWVDPGCVCDLFCDCVDP